MYPAHVFAELFEAVPAAIEGRVFVAFDYAENVRDEAIDSGGVVHVGMDFNVNPMTASFSSKVGDQLHTFDELALFNSNTEDMCVAIRDKFRERKIIVYPDATNGRSTNADKNVTDHTILHKHGFTVRADRSNPKQRSRINETNAMLCDASGRRRAFINPRCKKLIESLEYLIYKPGTSVVDKDHGLDHFADGYGYKIHQMFPIRSTTQAQGDF